MFKVLENRKDLTIDFVSWCYVWRDSYNEVVEVKDFSNDFTRLLFGLTGKIGFNLYGHRKYFKRDIDFYVQKSSCGNKYRACIKEVF